MSSISKGVKLGLVTTAIAMLTQVGVVYAATNSGTTTPTASASANSTLDFNAVPLAKSNVNPKITSYFYLKGTPGQQDKVGFELINETQKPEVVKLSTVLSSTGMNGGMVFANHSSKNTWVTNLPASVALAPKQTKDVYFNVSVPSDTVAGDYTFGLSMQDHSASSMSSTKNSKFSVNLKRQIRRVLAVEVKVPGAVMGKAHMEKAQLKMFPSGVYLDLVGNNTGNFISTYNGSVTISGPHINPSTFPITQALLAPRDPFQFEYKWMSGHPSIGKYEVQVHLTNGVATENKTLYFSITAPELKKAQLLTGQSMISTVVPSWIYYAAGGVIFLLLLVGLGGWMYIRKLKKA